MLLGLLLLLFTAIEISPGASSPYTSTDETNKFKIYINETIQKHSTNNTKHSKIQVYILPEQAHYCQNSHTLQNTHTNTHTLQNKHSTR